MTVHHPLHGQCPMGCGETLFVATGGYITCGLHTCPNPSAVAEILADRETVDIVTINEDTFTVRHPLRERLGDQLDTCDAHQFVVARCWSDEPPTAGRYRMVPLRGTALSERYRLELIEQ